jgi:hypothetical protein
MQSLAITFFLEALRNCEKRSARSDFPPPLPRTPLLYSKRKYNKRFECGQKTFYLIRL